MRNISGKKILAFCGVFLFIMMSSAPMFVIARSDEVARLYQYRGISERSLDQKLFGKDSINRFPSSLAQSPGVVTLTFDDGYENIYKNAFPILDQHHMQASLFMITGRNEFQESPLLNLSELVQLKAHGWDIDAHSVTHADLTKLNLSEIRYEVVDSKQWIIQNNLGNPVAFAYPYGKNNFRSRFIVHANYQYGRTMVPGFNDLNTRKNAALKTYALWGTSNHGSLELCKRKTTEALKTGKWIIITLHGVVNDPTYYKVSPYYLWTTTEALADYASFLINNSALVETFSQLPS